MKFHENKRYEVDLYLPIKELLMEQGYAVYGEVKHCDVAAVKGDELVIVELKLALNTELLIQAAKRLRLTSQVYVAIVKPKFSLRSKRWKDICHLLRRLELGMIIITFHETGSQTEIIFHPAPFDRERSMKSSRKKRNEILSEINGRIADFNVGGSNRTKIMSAYKENCIHIACCLLQYGPLSAIKLQEIGTGDKTSSILIKNYYGWFDRVQRGIYMLNEKGKEELQTFPELMNYYNEK